MDWRRENELYRSREKEMSRDSRRERKRDRSRDRDSCRERELDRSRDRDSCRERKRDKSRDSDRGRERERNRGRDRGGDGTENNRYTDSWHPRNDAPEYHRDRTRKNNSEKYDSSKNGSLARVEDELKRDEDEEEDYQERVSLQLVEQEEEDLNRIKEESRRRRQAILEKYKTQQLQQQVKSSSGDVGKDKSRGQLLTSANSHPANSDGKNDCNETSFSVEKSPSQDVIPALETTCDDRAKSEKPKDMFHDDIFGESPAVCKSVKGNVLPIKRCGLQDNLDDADGYTYMHGEILGEKQGGKFDGRYQVTAAHGKGVFSTVVRANDLKASNGEPKEVAVKIIRNNEIMFKAGQSELVILSKLVGADPEDKRHCIRLFSSFEYRKHLCLVFESLDMNLRQVIKKYGSIGLNLAGVKALAKQLFIALKHLQNCGVLHCDIKPDNILVNERRSVLKLCDFGNAMFAGKNDLTPYLVSRFYRAPEIILGLPYYHALDMWSVGCCLYELYTGEVVFKGATNNDMLRLYMELKGPFPKKMLRKGLFVDQHFDKDFNFIAMEVDPVTKKVIKRRIDNVKRNDIGKMVTGSSGDDPKMVADFKNLLGKMFMLDPEKRLTVSQALNHPFITRTSEQ